MKKKHINPSEIEVSTAPFILYLCLQILIGILKRRTHHYNLMNQAK